MKLTLLSTALILTAMVVESPGAFASTLYYKTNDACTLDREGDVTLKISTDQVPFIANPLSEAQGKCLSFSAADHGDRFCTRSIQTGWDAAEDVEVASATLTVTKDGKTTVSGPVPLTLTASAVGTGAHTPASLDGQHFTLRADADVMAMAFTPFDMLSEGETGMEYPNRSGIVVGKDSALLKIPLVHQNGHLLPLPQAAKETFLTEITMNNFMLNVELERCSQVPFKLMVP